MYLVQVTQQKYQEDSRTANTVPSTTSTSIIETSVDGTGNDTSHALYSRTFRRTPPPNQLRLSNRKSSRAWPQCTKQSLSSIPSPGSSSLQGSSGSTASVKAFLHALAQPLDHLHSIFYDVGIRDVGSLLGLSRLRNRGDWLYILVVDRKITPLEYKFIADGLDDLVREKQ